MGRHSLFLKKTIWVLEMMNEENIKSRIESFRVRFEMGKKNAIPWRSDWMRCQKGWEPENDVEREGARERERERERER